MSRRFEPLHLMGLQVELTAAAVDFRASAGRRARTSELTDLSRRRAPPGEMARRHPGVRSDSEGQGFWRARRQPRHSVGCASRLGGAR